MASTWGSLTWSSNSWGSINNTISVTGLECNTGLLGENLVVNSVDLDSSFPNQFRATVQSNAGPSPFGTNDATLLKGNGSDTGSKVLFKFGFNTPSPGDIQTFSIFAKDSAGGTGGTFQLEVGNSSQRSNVQFNITNGARIGFASSSEVSFVEGDSVNFGNGWYRFRLTVQYESGFNKPNTNVGFQLNGSAADDPGAFVFGAQVEEQATLTSYKPTYGTAVSSNLSTQIDVAPVPTGLALTSSLGNEDVEISFEATPTGFGLTSSLGTADAGPDAMVTGLDTASLSLGTLDAFNVEGWGRRTWNSFAWGIGGTLESTGLPLKPLLSSLSITGDANVTPTGLALTSSLGNEDIEISFQIELTGQALTSNLGIADAGPDAMATGNQATMATGTVEAYNQEGWGRYFWGLFEYGATGEWEFVTATSLPLTANLGNETVTGDANVSVTGIALTSNLGTADPSPDATVTGIGFSASLAVGSVITGTADVTVTGIGMPMGLGTGQLDAVSLIDVTGISMSVTLNSVTTKGFANVSVTGFALTSTLNNANTLIWNEIDTGSAPVWTEVPTRAA